MITRPAMKIALRTMIFTNLISTVLIPHPLIRFDLGGCRCEAAGCHAPLTQRLDAVEVPLVSVEERALKFPVVSAVAEVVTNSSEQFFDLLSATGANRTVPGTITFLAASLDYVSHDLPPTALYLLLFCRASWLRVGYAVLWVVISLCFGFLDAQNAP